MRAAVIQSIAHHFPTGRVTNDDLAALYPDWPAVKIFEKTGIRERPIVSKSETAADLGFAAAEKVIAKAEIDRSSVDLLIFCTQSPDYFLPTTACVLQERLGLPTTAAAFDYNLGCSAYSYGLAIVRGLIETGMASRALLVLGETYSRYMHPLDHSVRTLFGDAASATLITAEERQAPTLGPFVLGTDGSGARNLIVLRGAARSPASPVGVETTDRSGNVRTDANLFMNGPAIFEFTMRQVPVVIEQLLAKAQLRLDDVDHVVLHQANAYLLNALQRRLQIPEDKFATYFEHCGNTVSSTIPIVLEHMAETSHLTPGQLVMVVGFGVGYSWGANLIRWSPHA